MAPYLGKLSPYLPVPPVVSPLMQALTPEQLKVLQNYIMQDVLATLNQKIEHMFLYGTGEPELLRNVDLSEHYIHVSIPFKIGGLS
jgi:hypothetical protein